MYIINLNFQPSFVLPAIITPKKDAAAAYLAAAEAELLPA